MTSRRAVAAVFCFLALAWSVTALSPSEDTAIRAMAVAMPRLSLLPVPWSASDTSSACNAPWTGISCSNNNVVSLFLSNLNISGTIPPEIGGLTFLETLSLDRNSLTGPIPNEISGLVSLLTLNLFTNQLDGTIPSSMGNLTALVLLRLYDNKLSGPLPDSLGNLRNLTQFELSQNNLTGTIPASYSALSTLNRFYCHTNKLSGEINPSIFAGMTSLQFLQLYSNNFSGPLPPVIGAFNTLKQIYLYSNSFTGPIPTTWMNYTSLSVMDIRRNQLTGELPSDWTSLARFLQFLEIQYNNFTGTIPQSIYTCTKLQHFNLGNCAFNGTISSSICDLRSARQINLSVQRTLTGEVPSCFGTSFPNITDIFLNDNQLYGTIPQVWDAPILTKIQIFSNNFSGPVNISNLPALRFLFANNNNFSGPFPDLRASRLTLEIIDLYYNQFNSTIPSWLNTLTAVKAIRISHNSFRGSLPSLSAITPSIFEAASNDLSGSIPRNLFNYAALRQLDLSDNDISDVISIPNTAGLTNLNLSQNRFAGCFIRPNVLGTTTDVCYVGSNPFLCGCNATECGLLSCAVLNPTCSGSKPSPDALCVNGTWVVVGSVTISNGTLTLVSPTVIVGNLTLNSTAGLTLTTTAGTSLQVQGCATLGGNLRVVIDTLISQNISLITFDEGYCNGVVTRFSNVSVDLGCLSATSYELEYREKSLAILFMNLDDRNCIALAPNGERQTETGLTLSAMIGIIAGVIILVVIIILVVLFLFRRKIFAHYQIGKVTQRLQQLQLKKDLL